jgi:hypothetical protein
VTLLVWSRKISASLFSAGTGERKKVRLRAARKRRPVVLPPGIRVFPTIREEPTFAFNSSPQIGNCDQAYARNQCRRLNIEFAWVTDTGPDSKKTEDDTPFAQPSDIFRLIGCNARNFTPPVVF